MIDLDMWEEARCKAREQQKKDEAKYEQIRIESLKKKGINSHQYDYLQNNKPQYDSIYAMENGEATFLWIITMVVSAIFVDKWIIWIIATCIWLKYITRHKR